MGSTDFTNDDVSDAPERDPKPNDTTPKSAEEPLDRPIAESDSPRKTPSPAASGDATISAPSDGGSLIVPSPDAASVSADASRTGSNDDSSRGGGAGGGAGGPTIVGISSARPAGASSCHVPAEAQAEDTSRPDTVVGTGTPGSCTSREFVAAVDKGGVITFNCGPNAHTIRLDQTAKVNNHSRRVVIDGGGKIALSGGGQRRILYQNTCDAGRNITTSHCDNQESPQLTVQNLTFVDGNARGEEEGGGAIFAQGGRLKIVNSHFYNNVCHETGPDVGGGAVRVLMPYNKQTVYVVNSTFGAEGRGNVCSNGGALSSIGVSYTLIGSVFSHNRAVGVGANPAQSGTPGGGSGGAIYNDGTDFNLKVCGSSIEHNRANEGGGGIFYVSNDRSGSISIENSTMLDNPSGKFETAGLPGMYVEARGNANLSNSRVQ